jgi:hypothetical protein
MRLSPRSVLLFCRCALLSTPTPRITIEVQQDVVMNPELQVGGIAEEVEVRAETPLVQPTTSSLGQVVDNRKILAFGTSSFGVISSASEGRVIQLGVKLLY